MEFLLGNCKWRSYLPLNNPYGNEFSKKKDISFFNEFAPSVQYYCQQWMQMKMCLWGKVQCIYVRAIKKNGKLDDKLIGVLSSSFSLVLKSHLLSVECWQEVKARGNI
jgi:hypothetical protein